VYEPSGGDAERYPIADTQLAAPGLAHCRAGRETNHVHAVRDRLDPRRVGAERDGALRQIVAAGGHEPGGAKCAACGDACWRERLRDVDVGAVETDHQRYRGRRQRGHDASGNHPVSVHDGGPMPSGHGTRRAPSCRQRERRGEVRRATKRHVCPHRRGVTENVQRWQRRVSVEVKENAVFDRRPGDERMPRRDDVDLVAPGRH
jgi:hypothetical protein